MTVQIVVDPITCEAHGLCAELLPERITLDEWGYPIIDGTPIPAALHDLARRAANACPTLALSLRAAAVPEPEAPRRPRPTANGSGGAVRERRSRR